MVPLILVCVCVHHTHNVHGIYWPGIVLLIVYYYIQVSFIMESLMVMVYWSIMMAANMREDGVPIKEKVTLSLSLSVHPVLSLFLSCLSIIPVLSFSSPFSLSHNSFSIIFSPPHPGQGILRLSDGTVFEGEFHNHKQHGTGSLIDR